MARLRPSSVRALINSRFKLGQATQDRHHQPAMRSCGVGPAIGQRLERGAGLADGMEDVEEIAGAARQAIEASDDHGVALAERLEQLCKLGAI